MRVCVIMGTRPELIKMSPIIKELEKREQDFFLIHTGQHYSYELDGIFIKQLNIPTPKYNLNVGSDIPHKQIAKMVMGIGEVLTKEKCDLVLIEGDTNSVFVGAIVAAKLHIKVGHVEAGLRSYDKDMPEELNRVMVDHCSDLLFAPTQRARNILVGEGVRESKIFITGNTIVDAVYQMGICKEKKSPYFVATVHRTENVDNKYRFGLILAGLKMVAKCYKIPVIFPIHPHSLNKARGFGLDLEGLDVIDPVGYFDFLRLMGNAKAVLTDSGGAQEESCILKVPCITLRDNTERPETLEVGSNILAGVVPRKILQSVGTMLNRGNNWANPFGDGKAAVKIVDIVVGHC